MSCHTKTYTANHAYSKFAALLHFCSCYCAYHGLIINGYTVKPRVISAHPRLIRAVCVDFLRNRDNGPHAVFLSVRAQKNGVRACPYNRKPYRVRPHLACIHGQRVPNCYGVVQCVCLYNHFRCVTKMIPSGHVRDEEAYHRTYYGPHKSVLKFLCHICKK